MVVSDRVPCGSSECEVGQAAEAGGEVRRRVVVLEEEFFDGVVAVGGGEVHECVELVQPHLLRGGQVVVGRLAAQVPECELFLDGVRARGDRRNDSAARFDALAVELVRLLEVALVGHEVGGDDLEGHAQEGSR